MNDYTDWTAASTSYNTWASTSASSDTYTDLGTAVQKFFDSWNTAATSTGEYIRLFSQAFTTFTKWYTVKPHTPDKFIFIPGEETEHATQRLAPIDEALEIEGVTRVKEHLKKLLTDEEYRLQQLTEINKINKKLGLNEVEFDAEAVKHKLAEIEQFYSPVNVWKRKAEQWMKLKAEQKAQQLFNEVFTPEEIMKLETDKKLIISRNGLTFELLANGKINQLLPNGRKVGWCLVSKESGLPLHDILVMKKLILQTTPEIVLKTANKMSSPFRN